MDDGTGFRRNNAKSTFINSYKGRQIVERHNRLRFERKWHMKTRQIPLHRAVVRIEKYGVLSFSKMFRNLHFPVFV